MTNITSSTGITGLGLRATERTTTSSTGIARLGLRDTERTATTGEKMDHFDSEITCEEFYCDEDRLAWEERTLFFKEKESTMETLVSQAVVTTHNDSARPVGMVPLTITINDHTWTMMVPEDEYQAATNPTNDDDGQPDEYLEWQGLYEGDDCDHGQYDYC